MRAFVGFCLVVVSLTFAHPAVASSERWFTAGDLVFILVLLGIATILWLSAVQGVVAFVLWRRGRGRSLARTERRQVHRRALVYSSLVWTFCPCLWYPAMYGAAVPFKWLMNTPLFKALHTLLGGAF
ncbi:MAG: hypothetical protein ACO3JL_17495 [Myxococcota bacterium]